MSKAAPKFERVSLAELKARLRAEERRKRAEGKGAGDEPEDGWSWRRPEDQPGTNGRKGASKKSG